MKKFKDMTPKERFMTLITAVIYLGLSLCCFAILAFLALFVFGIFMILL